MKRRTIEVEFDIGDVVFLRVRSERWAGMVTAFTVKPHGIIYAVTWEDGHELWHAAIELTTEFVPEYSQDHGGTRTA